LTTIDQAVQQMRAAGLPALPDGHPRITGRIQRFGKEKKNWYVMREVLLRNGKSAIVGAFGTWTGTNTTKYTFEADWTGISDEERAELAQRIREQEEREREKREQQATNAGNRARAQWAGASLEGVSEYAQRKQITTPGLRFLADGTLLVPMLQQYASGPVLVGLQKIEADGSKRFNTGMSKTGAFCPIGKITSEDKLLFAAEGYATGRSVRMALEDQIPGLVGFDAGNLLPMLKAARARYPDAHFLICADDDFLFEPRVHRDLLQEYGIEAVIIDGTERMHAGKDGEYRVTASWKEGIAGLEFIEVYIQHADFSRRMRYENTGLVKAHEAALAIGNASVVAPAFSGRGDNKWTDWNDLHCIEGLEVCAEQLQAAILVALMPPEIRARQAEEALDTTAIKLEGEQDELLNMAAALVRQQKRATASLLQRHLRIGNNRAGRILDQLEQAGVIGAMQAGGKRDVLGAGADPAGAGGANSRETGPMDAERENSEQRWESHLARNDKGQILPVLSNVVHILRNSPDWDGVVAFEEFSGEVVKLRPPPFERGQAGLWVDKDDLRTTLWLQQKYSFHPRDDVVMKAVLLAADAQSRHVVREYLEPLVWDGTERLAHWMVDFLGAEDSEYVRRVSRKFMIGAVARIFKPGCKMDNVLILEGTQGLKKSTALKTLAGEWFTDAPLRFGDKDSYAIMRGKWFIELAELDSFNKADSEAAKQFFGQYVDRYRDFYGKRASDVPRQQVFAGSTNKYVYLKDETGNRRYWPVRAIEIFLEALAAARDQLWAEAVVAYRAGEPYWETPDDVPYFREQQEARFVNDSYTDLIADGLVGKLQTTVTDVLEHILRLDTAKWTMPEQQRVGRSLGQLGWMRKRGPMKAGRREWIYVRPEPEAGNGSNAPSGGEDDSPI